MKATTSGARVTAKKRFGQHFLERAWADKVVAAIAPQPDETIVEIGPGRGAITTGLARRASRVIAFEIDRDLASALDRLALPNTTIVDGDFLDVTPGVLADVVARVGTTGALRVAGNLPYNVASPMLFKLKELSAAGVPLVDATVMLQREVADRLLASPGTRDYGVLTVLIRHRAAVERLLQLPPGAFRPPPQVDSSVVRLRFHDPQPEVVDEGVFAALTQAMFTRRRKTVANALHAYAGRLAPAEALSRAGIDPGLRPEALAIDALARLSDVYARAVL
jgi:16S rRNA (adenine1518-N6/adenine1519-N6)-dimethyltransferase